MSTRLPAPDYTGRDYSSALTRLQRLVQSVFPQWTDFNKANFGNMLLRCMAFIVDILSKYTDFAATESLPEHAKLRRSVQSHGRWIGYKLSGRKAAQAAVTFTLTDGAIANDVTIQAGTLIRVSDPTNPIEFQLLADVTITAGQTSATGTVEHSENVPDEETSTGGPNQVYRLSQEPYIEGSMEVIAADGVYTVVENFLQSEHDDRHCTVEVDDDERPLVRFGNGIDGKIPEGDIDFEYKVGGGLEGNVEQNTITDLVDSVVDALGTAVSIGVTNAAAAVDGDDPETLAKAKQQAPAELRVLNRCIAREDYEITARDIPNVATCLFLTSEDTILIREGEGVGWVLAKGTRLDNGSFEVAAPSASLLREVEAAWRNLKPKPLGFYTRALGDTASNIVLVNIVATVHLNSNADKTVQVSGQPTNIGNDIFTALREYFAVVAADGSLAQNEGVDFGFNIKKADGTPVSELAWGTVFDIINDVGGVRKIDCDKLLLNGAGDDVPLRFWDFPILGTVLIIDADDNSQLYPAV